MIAMVLKILAFSHFLWGILWWFVITFHCSWVIISFHRRRIYARKCSATNSFQMDNNSQKVKGYGTHRAISQTFYSMLTNGKDVKVGERLLLFWVDNRIRSYAEDLLVNFFTRLLFLFRYKRGGALFLLCTLFLPCLYLMISAQKHLKRG